MGIFVGVDISKATFDVCIPTKETIENEGCDKKKYRYETIENTAIGCERFCEMLNGKLLGLVKPTKERKEDEDWQWQILCENTGLYHKLLLKIANRNGIRITVANSYATKKFMQSMSAKQKQTDKTDAYKLQQYGEKMKPEATPYNRENEELKMERVIVRRLKKQSEMLKKTENNVVFELTESEKKIKVAIAKTIEKAENKIKQQKYKEARMLINSMITEKITEQTDKIKEQTLIEKAITEIRDGDMYLRYLEIAGKNEETKKEAYQYYLRQVNKQYGAEMAAVMTIPGVGDVTAAEIMVISNGMKKFEKVNHFLSYLGVVPTGKDSGTTVNSVEKISDYVNKETRHMLVSATNSAIKWNDEVKQKYNIMIVKGKHANKAKIAAAKTLAKQIYYCAKNKENYKTINERERKNEQKNASMVTVVVG